MRWLIIEHPLRGRVLMELSEDDDVGDIMRNNPESELVDVAVSEGDDNNGE